MSEDAPAATSVNVLVVDDDEIILLALTETLKRMGHSVVTTHNPVDGLKHLQKESFGVIISDQLMSEMSGLDFLRQAREVQPMASRILITGVVTLKTLIDAVNEGEIFRFVAKPWVREELRATITNAVQRYHLVISNEELQKETQHLNAKLEESNAEMSREVERLRQENQKLSEENQRLQENLQAAGLSQNESG